MASHGFNFRQTSGYVTDDADETYVLHTTSYPTTRNGVTFGWESVPNTSRDRSTSVDHRLAGMNESANGEAQDVFRVDLPAGAGDYEIEAAFGDATSGAQVEFQIADDTTVFIDNSPATSLAPGNFLDAAKATYSAANWPGNQTAVARTFTSSILRIYLGDADGTGNSKIAHLNVIEIGATTESISGTSAGTSTDTAAATVNVTGTATSAGTSTDTGAITATSSVSGTSPGTSVDTGAATSATRITGTSAGTSTDTGAVTTSSQGAAAGTSAGTSTDTAAATATASLSGTSAGLSADSVAAIATAALGGTSPGSSVDTTTAKLMAALTATSAGTSSDTGTATFGAFIQLPPFVANAVTPNTVADRR